VAGGLEAGALRCDESGLDPVSVIVTVAVSGGRRDQVDQPRARRDRNVEGPGTLRLAHDRKRARAGLRVGLYFSHPDWCDGDFRFDEWGPLRDPACTPRSDPAAWARFRARHRGKLTEPLSRYGRIDMLSLDMWLPAFAWPHLKETIRALRGVLAPLDWSVLGDDLVILLPERLQAEENRPCRQAWAFRTEGGAGPPAGSLTRATPGSTRRSPSWRSGPHPERRRARPAAGTAAGPRSGPGACRAGDSALRAPGARRVGRARRSGRPRPRGSGRPGGWSRAGAR
jgi:hypothetical protein